MPEVVIEASTLVCHLREELQENSGEAANDGGSPKWRKTAADYRTSLSAIIACHLSMLRTEKKRKANAE